MRAECSAGELAFGEVSGRRIVADLAGGLTEQLALGKAEWTQNAASPRFVVTSLTPVEAGARPLYETIYCAHCEMG